MYAGHYWGDCSAVTSSSDESLSTFVWTQQMSLFFSVQLVWDHDWNIHNAGDRSLNFREHNTLQHTCVNKSPLLASFKQWRSAIFFLSRSMLEIETVKFTTVSMYGCTWIYHIFHVYGFHLKLSLKNARDGIGFDKILCNCFFLPESIAKFAKNASLITIIVQIVTLQLIRCVLREWAKVMVHLLVVCRHDSEIV